MRPWIRLPMSSSPLWRSRNAISCHRTAGDENLSTATWIPARLVLSRASVISVSTRETGDSSRGELQHVGQSQGYISESICLPFWVCPSRATDVLNRFRSIMILDNFEDVRKSCIDRPHLTREDHVGYDELFNYSGQRSYPTEMKSLKLAYLNTFPTRSIIRMICI
jgi:hypothetical protein